MPNKRPPIKLFTPAQRRELLTRGRLIRRQNELDIRGLKRAMDSSLLPGRILVITPRKIGNAPQRNRLRRRLTALYHEEGLYKKSYDIVIYCRKGSTDLSFQDLKALLLATFSTLTL